MLRRSFVRYFKVGFKISFIDCSIFPNAGKIKDCKCVVFRYGLYYTAEKH